MFFRMFFQCLSSWGFLRSTYVHECNQFVSIIIRLWTFKGDFSRAFRSRINLRIFSQTIRSFDNIFLVPIKLWNLLKYFSPKLWYHQRKIFFYALSGFCLEYVYIFKEITRGYIKPILF